MQNKNSITLVPDSASYTAVQTFLEQRLEAARRVALLWNMGKVIHTGVGD